MLTTDTRPADYKSGGRANNLEIASAQARSGSAATAGDQPASGLAAVEKVLQLLARAVQQFHTYPPTSPLCVTATDACHRALAGLEIHQQIAFRVTPRALLVDDVEVGTGTIVEQELARRLHTAAVAAVSVAHAASPREIARFCGDLIACGARGAGGLTLLDRLTEHGVDRITVEMAARPQVLGLGAPSSPALDAVHRERVRRDALPAGPSSHLYPPGKAWIRLDPATDLQAVSLLDLALLADSPARLAGMLLRLTDDELPEDGEAGALEQKYSDIATIFSALHPGLARAMFARLARAVLDLAPERRQALLKRTILPGLLDGRQDGAVLRDFPDVDLAESLCLLLDLEAAAPEVVTTALARLDLPADRHAAVAPLIEAGLRERSARTRATSVESHARKLTDVGGAPRSYAEFAAFDLAMDAGTSHALALVRDQASASDFESARLGTIAALVRLEPNPESVERFMSRALTLVEHLGQLGQWAALADWLTRFGQIAAGLQETRPDAAEAIRRSLAAFASVDFARILIDLAATDGPGRDTAGAIVDAVGPDMGAALLEALAPGAQGGGHSETRVRTAAQLICDKAAGLAPGLAPLLPCVQPPAARIIVRALGLAGRGYEPAVGEQLAARDELTAREALRALARIASPRAAALVTEMIQAGGRIAPAAEETLWHFPPAEAERQVRDLLGRRDFVARHPDAAVRMMQRLAQGRTAALHPVLRELAGLRFRIWNPALARVGRTASALLAS